MIANLSWVEANLSDSAVARLVTKADQKEQEHRDWRLRLRLRR